jgi:KamA family protein
VPKSADAWRPAIDQIAIDSSIGEVLISGGDPLILVDPLIESLLKMLAQVPHVRRVRLHTRLPIVLPQRVTNGLLQLLTGTRLTPIVVVHANHPQELGPDVAEAIGRLVSAGIPVLNQSVLLAGVNDDADTLCRLCEALIDLRVIPYYLHQLDRVRGTAHFEVPSERGRDLIKEIRARLPGYAVPRYVQEVPGLPHKAVLA